MTTLRIEQDPIEVTPLLEPDLEWVQVCSVGHEHRWRRHGVMEPAVDKVVETPATDDYPEIAFFACAETREPIIPRYRTPQNRSYAIGHVRYYVDEKEVRFEEFEIVMAEASEVGQ